MGTQHLHDRLTGWADGAAVLGKRRPTNARTIIAITKVTFYATCIIGILHDAGRAWQPGHVGQTGRTGTLTAAAEQAKCDAAMR